MADKYDGELLRRLAALERRVAKLEMTTDEFDRVIDPQGWIGEAFEKLEEDIDDKFKEVNGKLDAILQRLTGFSDSE